MSAHITSVYPELHVRDDEYEVRLSRRENLFFIWDQYNWGLWSSPNRSRLPGSVHHPDQDFGRYSDYSRHPAKTRWIQKTQPFLGFWPVHVPWTGPFACLNILPGRVPISAFGTLYHLDSDVIQEWQTLEDRLFQLGSGLLSQNLVLPSYDTGIVCPAPSSCGYGEARPRMEQVIGAAFATRHTFIALTAYVSFSIALDMARNPHGSQEAPHWLAFAEERLKMDPVWLNEIHQSFVCKFKAGYRAGVYMFHYHNTYTDALTAYTVGEVPLYICWGFTPPVHVGVAVQDSIWRYRPSHAEAKEAIDAACSRLPKEVDPRGRFNFWWNMVFEKVFDETIGPAGFGSSRPSFDEPPPLPLPHKQITTALSVLPGPHSPRPPPCNDVASVTRPAHEYSSSSRSSPSQTYGTADVTQLDLESPESPRESTVLYPFDMDLAAWLQEIEEERREIMKQESGDERERRTQQEASAKRDNANEKLVSPTIGAYMYVWEKSDVRKYQRRRVDDSEWDNEWALHKPEHRHYVSIYGEWHLISEGQQSFEEPGERPVEEEPLLPFPLAGARRTIEEAMELSPRVRV